MDQMQALQLKDLQILNQVSQLVVLVTLQKLPILKRVKK